jgi:tRNA(Arg) A34 adenosine deaminase TadA
MNSEFMKRAIELSRINMHQGTGGPFGAVIVKNSKIIGEGWNKVTSINDPTAHAEVEAIRMAAAHIKNFQLTGCEIYTSCEPCPMCLAAIYWARLDKIYFANTKADAAKIDFDDEFLYQELARPKEQRKIPTQQLLHGEAIEVFNEWRAKSDKIPY